MKTILCICLVLASPLTTIAATEANVQQASEDHKALQGVWIPVEAELGRQPMPDAVLKTISLKLTKHEYEAIVAGKSDKGTWTIDSTATPKSMDVTGVKGPNAGKTFPAIYELSADTLRVCYDISGAGRPRSSRPARARNSIW